MDDARRALLVFRVSRRPIRSRRPHPRRCLRGGARRTRRDGSSGRRRVRLRDARAPPPWRLLRPGVSRWRFAPPSWVGGTRATTEPPGVGRRGRRRRGRRRRRRACRGVARRGGSPRSRTRRRRGRGRGRGGRTPRRFALRSEITRPPPGRTTEPSGRAGAGGRCRNSTRSRARRKARADWRATGG